MSPLQVEHMPVIFLQWTSPDPVDTLAAVSDRTSPEPVLIVATLPLTVTSPLVETRF
jgi:hypothetical protein